MLRVSGGQFDLTGGSISGQGTLPDSSVWIPTGFQPYAHSYKPNRVLGQVTVEHGAILSLSDLEMRVEWLPTDTSISVGGTLTIIDRLDWFGGGIVGVVGGDLLEGHVLISDGARLIIPGLDQNGPNGDPSRFLENIRLTNRGTIQLPANSSGFEVTQSLLHNESGAVIEIDTASQIRFSGGILRNEAGAAIELVGTGSLLNGCCSSNGTLENFGSLQKSGEGNAAIAPALSNSGTLIIDSGDLLLSGGFTQVDGSTEDKASWLCYG